MDLTTSTRVLLLLEQGGVTQTSLATLVAQVISAVSAEAERYLDRHALAAERTEYFDLDAGQRVVRLKGYPVTAITWVRNDWQHLFTDGDVDSGDYVAHLDTGRLVLDQVIPDVGTKVLGVKYTGGMAATAATFATAYPDIAGVVDAQVAYLIQRRQALGGTNVSAGGASESWSEGFDWLPRVRRVLDLHRRW